MSRNDDKTGHSPGDYYSWADGAEAYQRFIRNAFGIENATRLHEDPPPLPGLDPLPSELELQSRWYRGEFGEQFLTTCGKHVRIRQFGHWNRGAGPDFPDAAIEIDTPGEAPNIRSGPIELDPDARDWENHGHGSNPNFDGVILHVFFSQPESTRFYTRTSDHREVPQVLLSPEVEDTGGSRNFLLQYAEAKIGRCATPLAAMPADQVNSLLEAAAQMRLRIKAQRFARIARLHSPSQALYEGLAEALGYAPNQLPMRILAQRLPLSELRRLDPDLAEALLFGHAGFLDAAEFETYSIPTKGYLRGLWDGWWRYRDSGEQQMELPPFTLSGFRPGNHPQRRLGALAAIAANWPKIDAASREGPKKFARALGKLEHSFWSGTFTLKSDPADRPIALIGASRISEILANVLFPILVPDRPETWSDYTAQASGQTNSKLKRAAIRLLGERSDAASFQRRAFQQQGLLQIYQDFCLVDDSGCDECPFPEQLRDWKK